MTSYRPAFYLRATRGLTITEVAEATGIKRGTLAGFERGKIEPHGPTLKRLAEYYAVPVRELFEEPEASIPPAA